MAITAYGRGRRKQTIHLRDPELKHFSACGHSSAACVSIQSVQIIDCKKCLAKIAKEQGR